MPNNKCYSTREMVLDKMLQNEHGYTLQELMDACNRQLRFDGFATVTSLNTIAADLLNISNRYGENAKVEVIRDSFDGRIKYYRYKTPGFSIYKLKLNEEEHKTLDAAKGILSKVQGFLPPGWLSEFDVRLRSLMLNETGDRPVIGFDADPEYRGNQYLNKLYDAITKKQVVSMTYAPFGYEPRELEVSPYFIHQSGHFWYLIASEKGSLPRSYGLDRIQGIGLSEASVYEPCSINLDNYFRNRVGVVGGSPYAPVEKVTFVAAEDVWPYLEMAPIHPSQKMVGWTYDNRCIMQIEVCDTEELRHELCKYGGGITVIEPAHLRKEVAGSFARGIRSYGYKMDMDSIGDIITYDADAFSMNLEKLEMEHPDTGEMMNVLNLAISGADLDRIIDGSKTDETRSIKPRTAARYVNVDEEGFKITNRDHHPTPVKYDAIEFVAYDDDSKPIVLVEVKGIDIDMFVDPNSGVIHTYNYLGRTWVEEDITYHLGSVLFVEDGILSESEEREIQLNNSIIRGMKTLTLIIKQQWFDQIISGEKTQEFREVKPTTVKKYIELDDDGYEKEDEYGNSIPIKYDAIQFYVGYNKDRDSALVEVKDAHVEMFVDENNEIITYEAEGKDWVAEQVVYCLGKVLEKNIHKK